ncbi:MAG: tRNA (adenine-N1)-methyltransferase, partial [Actinomycetota bacterium]
MDQRRVFEAGERALLIDSRGRRYMVGLQAGGHFHFHRGIIAHDDVIGHGEGRILRATSGERVVVLRPTYADFILKMKRGAQLIYPKDVAAILSRADIYPGATVLEAGTGSGALTMALSLAVGPEGRVVSYELREDHLATARSNIEAFLGKAENLDLIHASIYDPIEALEADRC